VQSSCAFEKKNAVAAGVVLLQHEIRIEFPVCLLFWSSFFLCSFALFGHCIMVHFGPFSLNIMMHSSFARSREKSVKQTSPTCKCISAITGPRDICSGIGYP
jgi:predicted membrane protein